MSEQESGLPAVPSPEYFTLPAFGSILLCPKCAFDHIFTEYHATGRMYGPCGAKFGWPDVQHLGEHLCRTCDRCKYGWPEATYASG